MTATTRPDLDESVIHAAWVLATATMADCPQVVDDVRRNEDPDDLVDALLSIVENLMRERFTPLVEVLEQVPWAASEAATYRAKTDQSGEEHRRAVRPLPETP
ncbi:hypothetical protein [Streptomyces sp. NPDC055085]